MGRATPIVPVHRPNKDVKAQNARPANWLAWAVNRHDWAGEIKDMWDAALPVMYNARWTRGHGRGSTWGPDDMAQFAAVVDALARGDLRISSHLELVHALVMAQAEDVVTGTLAFSMGGRVFGSFTPLTQAQGILRRYGGQKNPLSTNVASLTKEQADSATAVLSEGVRRALGLV